MALATSLHIYPLIYKNSLKNAQTSSCPEILTHFSIYPDNTKTIPFDVMQPNVCKKKRLKLHDINGPC